MAKTTERYAAKKAARSGIYVSIGPRGKTLNERVSGEATSLVPSFDSVSATLAVLELFDQGDAEEQHTTYEALESGLEETRRAERATNVK